MEPTSQSAATPMCYRHTDVGTHVSCTRCDRPICPDCMREASVGFHCPECVREGSRSVRQARTVAGGRISAVPLVTYVLIALNVIAYVAEIVWPGVVAQLEMVGRGLVGPDGVRYHYQELYPAGFHTDGVAEGDWYRLLTGAFLHLPPGDSPFALLHILFNMASLWSLGRIVEAQLGRARYLALYLVSALGGSVLVLLLAPEAPTLGASGAVFGLGAAYYVTMRRLGADRRQLNQFMAYFLLWMLISAGFTSWQGHLGGLLTGALVTAGLVYAPRERRNLMQGLACGAVVALLVVLTVVRVSAL